MPRRSGLRKDYPLGSEGGLRVDSRSTTVNKKEGHKDVLLVKDSRDKRVVR
jgi:hypothetical protein